MNTIGIGGAGSKIAAALDPDCTVINVSQIELEKTEAAKRILAVVHSRAGQLQGSRKDPQIGSDAFLSVKEELLDLARGSLVLSSTGGGTGNGISSGLLRELSAHEHLAPPDSSTLGFVLPYPHAEPTEYVNNTIDFLENPLSTAIDSGNTGNIYLFSNRLKFENRLPEEEFNQQVVDSLKAFLSIPEKNASSRLLDGHIDYEDFALFQARPYFNHFTYFTYDPETPFGEQLEQNYNPFLLEPDSPIEALFLLEVPKNSDPTCFYDILDYFTEHNVSPVYSVIENPQLRNPYVTVSLLYSRKPADLVADFQRVSEEQTEAKVRKALEQNVALPKLEVNMESEAKRVARKQGADEGDVLAILRRLGKL